MGIEGSKNGGGTRRLRLGMVGGGQGAFIGAVHRLAARMDDRYEFVAGALSSDPERAKTSAAELGLDPDRSYGSYEAMAKAEAARSDGIDVVSVVTPNNTHHPIAKTSLEAGIHVICDKPLCTSLEEAHDLRHAVEASGKVFVLTHNYTGYPMIRQARAMIEAGELGAIRLVQAEYAQDWLSTKLEDSGHKQASWRTDPKQSGPAGCLGDIGTHAYNLARFVTGLGCDSLMADLTSFVEGRVLDDNVHIMLRFEGGAKGMLWASQVAPGNENGLKLRIYGEKAGLHWEQENPNYLRYAPLNEEPRMITRGGAGSGEAAGRVTRTPPGHPEGYLEGFANIYSDAADLIHAANSKQPADTAANWVPGIKEGLEGVAFITATIESSHRGGVWVKPEA
ncbi:MAG: Gfo/Idh/MocA family oxidoreductase [Pseudomonadota bacterium]